MCTVSITVLEDRCSRRSITLVAQKLRSRWSSSLRKFPGSQYVNRSSRITVHKAAVQMEVNVFFFSSLDLSIFAIFSPSSSTRDTEDFTIPELLHIQTPRRTSGEVIFYANKLRRSTIDRSSRQPDPTIFFRASHGGGHRAGSAPPNSHSVFHVTAPALRFRLLT